MRIYIRALLSLLLAAASATSVAGQTCGSRSQAEARGRLSSIRW